MRHAGGESDTSAPSLSADFRRTGRRSARPGRPVDGTKDVGAEPLSTQPITLAGNAPTGRLRRPGSCVPTGFADLRVRYWTDTRACPDRKPRLVTDHNDDVPADDERPGTDPFPQAVDPDPATPPSWPAQQPIHHTEPLHRPPGVGGQPGAAPAPWPGPPAQQPPWPSRHAQHPYPPHPGLPHPGLRPAGPPASYADLVRPGDLAPAARPAPTRGWRKALLQATFGLVNLGPSPDEIREAELEARIRGALRGHYKIGVMGKGGVGKTTVAAAVGSVFAELRQDRVVAVDADTAFGKLGSRVDPKAVGSYWELASDQHLETFADIRNRVGNNAAGLFVLAGEGSPARRRVLDAAIYREAISRLDRHFTISIIDCGSTMDSPVTKEVLRDLDALIVVSSPWADGASAAGQTLDWLASRGMRGLVHRSVLVLNDSDGHADKRSRSGLAGQFAQQGQAVVEVPFDGRLRPGGVISGTAEMSRSTRRRFIEVAAALAAHFPTSDDRHRERF